MDSSMVIPAQDGHAEVNYQALSKERVDKTGDQQGRTLTPEFSETIGIRRSQQFYGKFLRK
jgi:hypothetical protein